MTDVSVPARALLLLALALFAALIPHLSYLPVWFYALASGVVGWRLLVWRGYLSYPGKLPRVIAVVVASVAVYETSGRQMSLEAAGAFLVAASLLKVLEVSKRRDAVVIVFLVFFLQAVGFLFDQSIAAAVIGAITVYLGCAAMIAVQASGRQGLPSRLPVFRTALNMMLVALPFMLVLYVLFPRLAPLWSVALQSERAFSALQEEMAPGDIASLTQSDGLAFRATFDNERPPRYALYWRARVLDQYDGRRWRDSGFAATDWQASSGAGAKYQYEVIMEPTGQQYLLSLAGAASPERAIGVTDTGLLQHQQPLMQKLRYRAYSSGLNGSDGQALKRGAMYLAIPPDSNPRTVEWARSLSEGVSTNAFVQRMLEFFARESFYYTLRPDRYGENDIDAFLFGARRGFCAHYASAMAFAARAAGIPSRVVAGYQGGEWHPDGYLSVRQYDAHAWVELWDGKQWQAYDPTAAVSPLRIEFGLQRAVADEGSFLEQQPLSPLRFTDLGWVNRLRLQLESINYYWNRWVLSYDGRRQNQFLRNWLGLNDFAEGLYIIAGLIAVSFAFFSTILWWRGRDTGKSELVKSWEYVLSSAVVAGVECGAGDAPLTVLSRVSQRYPDMVKEVSDVQVMLSASLYSGQETDNRELVLCLKKLGRRLLRVRPGAETAPTSDIHKRTV